MNLLILGGTRRTGLLLLAEALERGYHVRALVRDTHSVTIPRADVAKFMLDALKSGEYLHQTPTISGK